MNFSKLVPSVFYIDISDGLKLFVDCLQFSMEHQDLVASQPYCVLKKNGIRIMVFQDEQLAKEHYPELRLETDNIEEGEGEIENEREPDFRRMERIRFPKFVIDNYPNNNFLIWEKLIGGDQRVHILNEEKHYLVVLTRRKDYLMLCTAFYIEQEHTVRKKIKDYEAYKKTKTA